MSTKINLRDIGWMYHAPPKSEDREEVRVPPVSQIPCLGNMPDDAFPSELDNLKKNLFKSTDTPYITLAKMGGRADLLAIQPSESGSHDPVGYPRCDWFYLEDNALEDASKDSADYISRQPDYMVHQAYGGCDSESGDYGDSPCPGKPRGRVPFAMDTGRCGDPMTRSKKMLEPRPFGYGIRTEKAKELDARRLAKSGKNAQHIKPDIEVVAKQRALQRSHGVDAVIMGKLLSNGYVHEWDEQKRRWEKENANTGPAVTREKVAGVTEYSEMYETTAGHRKPVAREAATTGNKPAKAGNKQVTKKAASSSRQPPVKA